MKRLSERQVKQITNSIAKGTSTRTIAEKLKIPEKLLRKLYGAAIKEIQHTKLTTIHNVPKKGFLLIQNNYASYQKLTALKRKLSDQFPDTSILCSDRRISIQILPPLRPEEKLLVSNLYSENNPPKNLNINPDQLILSEERAFVQILNPSPESVFLISPSSDNPEQFIKTLSQYFPNNKVITPDENYLGNDSYENLLAAQTTIQDAIDKWEPLIKAISKESTDPIHTVKILSKSGIKPEHFNKKKFTISAEWLRNYIHTYGNLLLELNWPENPSSDNPSHVGSIAGIPLYLWDAQSISQDIILFSL